MEMRGLRKLKNLKIRHVKLASAVLIILLILSISSYGYLFYKSYAKDEFVDTSIEIANRSQESVFRLSKVLFYHNANAEDNSRDKSLQNLSISQYSDIAIYIDNTTYITDLTKQNTVKELWIDNIQVNADTEKGSPYLNYKNLNNFGSFQLLDVPSEERISFSIVNTNAENEVADYSKPTFYADCSNPISLGYINRNIFEKFSISDENPSVTFNGKLLKQAGIPLESLHYVLSFDINIVNYENQRFVYHASFDISLIDDGNSLYEGDLQQIRNFGEGTEYNFFKVGL